MGWLRRARRIGLAAAVGAVIAIVAGCSLGPSSSAIATPAGPVRTLEAVEIAWRPTRLDLPAGVAVTIVVDNRDAGIPHGFEVRRMDDGLSVFQGELVTGPASRHYLLPDLAAGAYVFVCPVHVTMTGEIFVR